MVREEMVFRSGQLPTVMETIDEQGDTGSQEGMETAPWEIELPDEGVVSQEETESQDETESQEEAESQEETKSQDEMEPQMETPNNLHWNWADEVEDMVERQIDKKLELWEKCCGEAGHVKQICCRCQRAGHRARECNAKKTLDGGEVFFQANKTYAHIINQAQEEAANCKRPGPNWKEVPDVHKYLNVR